MYNLKFIRSNGEKIDLGTVNTELECVKNIYAFCESHNYKIPYIRCTELDYGKEYDVGSHTEFFEVINDGKNNSI